MNVYIIDLFCGAGGTSTGAELAGAKVLACVNHDANAIKSHSNNHPDTIHFTEDIRNFNVVMKLSNLVKAKRLEEPNCKMILWASLECTNFSNAKGGLPKDADSRTLANDLFMYLSELNPDLLMIENVREFMSWGPIDENGKPESRTKGRDYVRWCNNVINCHGFNNMDFKIMNSADYGSVQARKRLFIQFAKPSYQIVWPTIKFSKNISSDGLFDSELKPYRAVREVLHLHNKGKSIFERKIPLVENTLKRIYAGLVKFVANGEDEFLVKNYSGNVNDKVKSLNDSCGTITTIDNKTLCFIQTYNGNGQTHNINSPSPTVTTNDRLSTVFVSSNKEKIIGKMDNHFLLNPQYNDKGRSIDRPCFTLIARMDKSPPSIVNIEHGNKIEILDTDSVMTVKIKKFMLQHELSDIKTRMLVIDELKQIQGFPKDYKLFGTQAEQKKQIGNAVDVYQATALIGTVVNKLKTHK